MNNAMLEESAIEPTTSRVDVRRSEAGGRDIPTERVPVGIATIDRLQSICNRKARLEVAPSRFNCTEVSPRYGKVCGSHTNVYDMTSSRRINATNRPTPSQEIAVWRKSW